MSLHLLIYKIYMSANYKITTPKEFFEISKAAPSDGSFFDHLASMLKSSLNSVWNTMKKIELNNTLNNRDIDQVKYNHAEITDNNKSGSKLLNSITKQTKKTTIQQLSCSKDKDYGSKKQMLKQKRQRKKISFDQFQRQLQKKLNQSFIRKNISDRKTLNRSLIQSQRQNSFLLNTEQLISENKQKDATNLGKKYELNRSNLLRFNQMRETQDTSNIPNVQRLYNGKLAPQIKNYIQDDSILNISDIDSQCDLNILNSSLMNDDWSVDANRCPRVNHKPNLEKQSSYSNLEQGQQPLNVPKLDLIDYPYPIFQKNHTLSHKNHNHLREKTLPRKKQVFQNKQPRASMLKRQHQIKQEPIDVDLIDSAVNNKQWIDVDNQVLEKLNHHEGQIRKRVKPTFEEEQQLGNSSQEEQIDVSTLEKYNKFDRIVTKKYDQLIESKICSNSQSLILSDQPKKHLKEQYNKFITKNFAAMIEQKHHIERQSSNKIQSQAQHKKSPQFLKPVDLNPSIDRKRLYTFRKQCESKISVAQQFRKSVMQNKHNEAIEILRKKQEEELKIKLQLQLEKQRVQRQESIRKSLEQAQNKSLIEEQQKQRVFQAQKLKVLNQSNSKQVSAQLLISPKQNQNSSPQINEGGISFGPKISLFNLGQIKSPEKKQHKQQNQTQKDQSKEKQPSKQNLAQITIKDSEQKKNQQTRKITQLISKPSEEKSSVADAKEGDILPVAIKKKNPFLEPPKSFANGQTILQSLINNTSTEGSLFKTSTVPVPSSPPSRSNSFINPSSFVSPLRNPPLNHNASHYSNAVDSSMCEEQESNITPNNSQFLTNILPGGQNLNGSFLNNSFSSTNNLFQNNSNSLFNNPVSGGLFGVHHQSIPQSNPFSGNRPGVFVPSHTPMNLNGRMQSTSIIPSFMKKPMQSFSNVSSVQAANLFSHRSPSKNQPTSLFGSTPVPSNDRKGQRTKKTRNQSRI